MGSQMVLVQQQNGLGSEISCLKKLENHLSQATESKRRPSMMEAYFQEINFYSSTGITRNESNGASARLRAKFR